MDIKDLTINSVVLSKKIHPCGDNRWQIIRVGADYKLKCLGCGHVILLSNAKLKNFIKEIVSE